MASRHFFDCVRASLTRIPADQLAAVSTTKAPYPPQNSLRCAPLASRWWCQLFFARSWHSGLSHHTRSSVSLIAHPLPHATHSADIGPRPSHGAPHRSHLITTTGPVVRRVNAERCRHPVRRIPSPNDSMREIIIRKSLRYRLHLLRRIAGHLLAGRKNDVLTTHDSTISSILTMPNHNP